MWRNYLTVGYRALTKNRTYAFINVLGLAIGLAACLMILLYVRYELSYDKWLPNGENVYQLQNWAQDRETGDKFALQMSQYVAGTALKKDFPQVEEVVYALAGAPVALKGNTALPVEDAIAVNGPFFDVLKLPFLHGDPATALAQPESVVLSRSEAVRLFGTDNPVGRTLTLVRRGEHVDTHVTGVIRDIPKYSHLRLNLVIRFDPNVYFADNPEFMTSWGEISGWNYVKLRPGSDPAAIAAAMPAWEKRNVPPANFGQGPVDQGEFQDWKLVNVRDVHLGQAQMGAMAPGNDRSTILTFGIVAILILGMACVNFTNLATARASQRAREVALRKVLGASRKQLVVQFMLESVMLTALAMLVALAFSELFLPILARFLDAQLELHYFGSGGLLVPILAMVVVVGIAGGIYPAFFLSRSQPAQVLKSGKTAAETPGSGRLRNALVVAQFAVSIGLIVCTAIVYGQTSHARTADPGFRREGILQLANLNRKQLQPIGETLVREAERIPGVVSAGRTGIGISTDNNMGRAVYVPGRAEPVNIGNYPVDAGFFETMGIRLVAGRTFDPNRPTDNFTAPMNPDPEAEKALVARGANVVVNELAARRLGFANPADAVGKQVKVGQFLDPASGLVPVTIVGVVKDTRFRSIRQPVDTIMYRLADDYLSHMVVRYDSAQPMAVRNRLEAMWRRLAPDVPFDAQFSEDIVSELYGAEQSRAETFAGFALLAVVVACLGLFGLAAFTAERRTKEIGIRKVLGARSRDIVKLLAWQFSKPVILANLIAWPVAWWVMREWLNGFDERISLSPVPFVAAGLLALMVAIVTISSHAIRVARANPINALRYE
jgi:putative ABC transport system permease protein